MSLKALLLDLDGTLLDTAPDMVGALNRLLDSLGKPPVEYELARQFVSRGAAGMLHIGLGLNAEDAQFAKMRQAFLDCYEQQVCVETKPFEGMLEVLEYCEQRQIVWGIVTNKPTFLTTPILRQLGLDSRSAITVCGDTLAVAKPHPAPLLHCTTLLQLAASDCLYVGDDERDIQAGTAAGMHTAAAQWGYIQTNTDIDAWQPDYIVRTPQGLLTLMQEQAAA